MDRSEWPPSAANAVRHQPTDSHQDDFGVKDINGNVVVTCNAKVFSIRNKKTITDPNSQFLFGIQKKILRRLSTFVAVDANGNEIFRGKNKIACQFVDMGV